MKHLIGRSRNDVAVYVNLIQSEASKRIAREPQLLRLVAEAIQQITIRKAVAQIEHNMGRVVGYSFVIKTTGSESVFYARLLRDDAYTRFVKNAKPTPTQHISMVLQQDKGIYELSDAWIGRFSPPRPGAANETHESRLYWADHAIILGNEPLQPRSITKECPY